MDDPAAFRKLLTESAVPDIFMAHMEFLGYTTIALLGHAVSGADQVETLVQALVPPRFG